MSSYSSDPRFSNYVAFLRYTRKSIVVCDSDAPGAFKVWRTPPTAGRDALLEIVNASDLKAWAIREIAAKALDRMDMKEPEMQEESNG